MNTAGSCLINYNTLERSIEYAAARGDHDVVLMGEEILSPVGKAKFACEKIRRRATEVWTDVSGQWKLTNRRLPEERLGRPGHHRAPDADSVAYQLGRVETDRL